MKIKSRYYAVCAASSCVWAAIAYVIGHQAMARDIIWGGIVVSPLIGLVVGAIYRPVYKRSVPAQIAMSLLSLYVAAALFGLGVGLFDVVQGLPGDVLRGTGAVISQSILGTLWGITFTGYVVVLWPLAHLNHRLLGRFAGSPNKAI